MDKRWIGGGAALVAALVAVAWWLGWFKHEDPLIAETRAAIATMQKQEEPAPEQRNALRAAWEERMKGMTDEQRTAMFEQIMPIVMPMYMQRFETDYDKFMAMTPEQQRAKLDERIDQMQKRMASGQGGGGPFGGGGNRPQMDPAKAAEFQKKMLAWTTPEQRAKFQNGMMMFANRMKERGLNPPPMPGGGFF
jgi:Spy/CpxP family protein refolding chaperone